MFAAVHVCTYPSSSLCMHWLLHHLQLGLLAIMAPWIGNRGVASHSDDVGSLEREIDGDGERWRKAETDRDRDEMAV